MRGLALLIGLAACSGGGLTVEPMSAPSSTASSVATATVAPVPTAVEPAPVVSAPEAPEAAPEPEGEKGRFLKAVVPEQEPAMPCDFSRTFTGKVGGVPKVFGSGTEVVLSLQRTASGALSGATHYARVGPALPVTGTAKEDGSFTFSERAGGSFAGTCNEKGWLTGTFTMGAKKDDFILLPHEAGRPAVYRYVREKKSGQCELSVTGLGYFGGSAASNRTLTRTLDTGTYRSSLAEITVCKDYVTRTETSSLAAYGPGFMSLMRFRSSDYGGAHPMHGAAPGGAIDLKTGRSIALGDIITNERPMRELMPQCLVDYLRVNELEESGEVPSALNEPDFDPCDVYPLDTYVWYCDDKPDEPTWLLTKEGLAILGVGHVHAESFRNGYGPILGWAVLKRLGVLQPNSPVKHLWADVKAAEVDDPGCTVAYGMFGIVHMTPFVRH